ncbi:biotin carboxyl carrier protein [Elusimicrobium simillimum]|uniref:acetyl-CoA carboxylase biotin carboxyl carrier protein n=1 Tax=Elusimicrobium simillimum TaxID=3143438 RepID=UPI003C6F367C
MDTKTLTQITTWLKETDIVEFVYKKDGQNIEIKTIEAPAAGTNFECNLTPVTSPAVGIYHRTIKGKAKVIAEGQKVAEGDILGTIEMPSKNHDVLAPVSGVLRVISIEEGKPVHYGQPLFFIES